MICPHGKAAHAGRSREEHNLLFAVIAAAFDNWPESHSFRPVDAEHLRAWLLIEVGHYESFVLDIDVADAAKLGMFLLHGKREFRIIRRGGRNVLLRPATIRKRSLGAAKYREIAQAVYEVIEAATGITPDAITAQ